MGDYQRFVLWVTSFDCWLVTGAGVAHGETPAVAFSELVRKLYGGTTQKTPVRS